MGVTADNRCYIALLLLLPILLVLTDSEVISAREDPSSDPQNVILITIDTLRADHVGCYGYGRNTTPVIDEFGRGATLFRTTIAPIPLTNPSHTSILTGLYPHNHGVINNKLLSIFEGVTMLPVVLKEKGMGTAAFVSGWTLKTGACTLNEYFDVYNDDYSKDSERKAGLTTEAAIMWLRQNAQKKFFLWIHYFDPHGNYLPPLEYVNRFYPVEKERDLLKYYGADRLQREKIIRSQKAKQQLVAQYDGEIAYADEYLGEVFSELKDLGLFHRSLIIVTSDHGESLTEHDYYFDHSVCLYDKSLKVPLLIKTPASFPRFERFVDENVGLIDIMPTILRLLNIPYEEEKLDGRDLTPLMRGEKPGWNETYYAKIFMGEIKPAKSLACIRTDHYKYIFTPPWWADLRRMKAEKELYGLEEDPEELHNIVDARRTISSQLRTQLSAWEAEGGRKIGSVKEREMSPETLKRLKALGYLQ
jgi:arylsulfatase A-like enzyme